MPHRPLLLDKPGSDRDRQLPPSDPKSEEAFRLVATLYQALVSAENSERSLRNVTSPDLVEFFRTVQRQQLSIAHRARSMLVDLKDAGTRMCDVYRTRVAG